MLKKTKQDISIVVGSVRYDLFIVRCCLQSVIRFGHQHLHVSHPSSFIRLQATSIFALVLPDAPEHKRSNEYDWKEHQQPDEEGPLLCPLWRNS